MAQTVRVVGAVIIRDGLVLCAQRGPNGNLPGLWEFPGGKVEAGETPEVALQREIAEELDCAIEVGQMVATTTHEYDFAIVNLTTFYCRLVAGAPHASEHASLRWLSPSALGTVEWAPADIPAVVQIQADLGP